MDKIRKIINSFSAGAFFFWSANAALITTAAYFFIRYRITGDPDLDGFGFNMFFGISKSFEASVFPFVRLVAFIMRDFVPAGLKFLNSALIVCPLFLGFSLAVSLRSFPAGIISSAFIFFVLRFEYFDPEQLLIASSVLAVLAVRLIPFKNRKAGQVFTAAALCAALQTKGITAPFVLFIVLYGYFKGGFKAALTLGHFKENFIIPSAVFFVCLAWGLVNFKIGNGFIFITENPARAVCNITTGAAGFVQTIEGDARNLLGIGESENSLLWAVGETVAHPLRYAGAVCGRFKYAVFSSCPALNLLLLSGSLLGLWFFRRDAEKFIVAVSSLYFAGVYLLMPVELRYFVPAECLMSVVCGLLFSGFPGPRRSGSSERRAAGFYFCIAGFPLIFLWLLSFVLFSVLPFRKESWDDIDYISRLADRFPRVVYINELAASKYLERGLLDKAGEYYGRVYRLEGNGGYYWRLLQIDFLKGKRIGREKLNIPPWHGDYLSLLYYSLSAYAQGEDEEGKKAAACAFDLCLPSKVYLRELKTAEDAGKLIKMRRGQAAECARFFRKAAAGTSAPAVAAEIGSEKRWTVYLENELKKNCTGNIMSDKCLLNKENSVPESCEEWGNDVDFRSDGFRPRDYFLVNFDSDYRFDLLPEKIRKRYNSCLNGPVDSRHLEEDIRICLKSAGDMKGRMKPGIESYVYELYWHISHLMYMGGREEESRKFLGYIISGDFGAEYKKNAGEFLRYIDENKQKNNQSVPDEI